MEHSTPITLQIRKSNITSGRLLVYLHDLLWVPVAVVVAFYVRFNLDEIPPGYYPGVRLLIALSLVVQAVLFWKLRLYRGVWKFISIPDLLKIVKAVLIGSVVITVACVFIDRFESVPRSIPFLYPFFLTLFLVAPRFCYRLVADRKLNLTTENGRKTVVVGAGQAGDILLRGLLRDPEYWPLALMDDNPGLWGKEIHGLRVYSCERELEHIVDLFDVDLVLLAIPSATPDFIKQIMARCSAIGVECRTLPTLSELAEKEIDVKQLRSLTLEDLLGRDPVKLDREAIAGYLAGRTILITGGGGSIGSELCRQVAGQNPKRLIIFDHGEFNLYSIELELRADFQTLTLEAVLGDVKNYDRIDWVFKEFRPDVVFHAAAYKHVPMVEHNPAEGVATNVGGSRILADAANRYKVDRFVFVSTDKAVNPANVMGTTKRIAEIYCQNLAEQSSTKFITTRFGNVLGSAGSVVPLFEKQIQAGGPVTVTHPDICRYFMTIPEAVSLILQAGTMGEGGEIFVLDMGEPVLIKYLAEQMILLSGLVPDKDIKIAFTGLRPGEKLYEEIFHESENLQPTTHSKLFLAGSRSCEWVWLIEALDALEEAATMRNVPALIRHLRQIVPEYKGAHLSDSYDG